MKKNISNMSILDNIDLHDYLSSNANPFYKTIEELNKTIGKKIIKENNLCLYALTRLNNDRVDDNKIKLFYEKDTTISELSEYENIVKLVPIDKEMYFSNLKNFSGRCVLVKVSDEKIFKGITDQFIVVVVMLETNENMVNKLSNMYKDHDYVSKFIEISQLSKYYSLSSSHIETEKKFLIEKIFSQFDYWNSFNNKINLNKYFHTRTILLSDNKSIGKINDCYMMEPVEDEDMAITGISNYEFPDHNVVEKKIIPYKNLLSSDYLSEKDKMKIMIKIVSSKDYCHFILNDYEMLKMFKENSYFRADSQMGYFFNYGWLCLIKEEVFRRSKCLETDRFIFDISTANQLPSFNYRSNPKNLYENPYMVTLYKNSFRSSPEKNIGGVALINDECNSIIDINEFRKRLNMFISNNEDLNIFENMDWTNVAVTGSCMAAILPSRNPLMSLCAAYIRKTYENSPSMIFKKFVETMFKDSDIDMPCNHPEFGDYIDFCYELREIVAKNVGHLNNSNVKITPKRTLAVYIDRTVLKQKCLSGEIDYSYEYVCENINNPEVKVIFHSIYAEEKSKNNKKYKNTIRKCIEKNKEYINFFDIVKINDVTIVLKDEIKPNDDDRNIDGYPLVSEIIEKNRIFMKYKENVKFEIVTGVTKSLELFYIGNIPIAKTIARFHLPCVRAYYNGSTCKIFASAITSYMTFMNVDVRYFAGKYEPFEIIEKYRLRGYGTVLNDKEIKEYYNYVKSKPNLLKNYTVGNPEDISRSDFEGVIYITDPYYIRIIDPLDPYWIVPGIMENRVVNYRWTANNYDTAVINMNGDVNKFNNFCFENYFAQMDQYKKFEIQNNKFDSNIDNNILNDFMDSLDEIKKLETIDTVNIVIPDVNPVPINHELESNESESNESSEDEYDSSDDDNSSEYDYDSSDSDIY